MIEIKEGQIWRHYKNELYRIVAVATNSDDRETVAISYRNVNGGKTTYWHYESEFRAKTKTGENRFELKIDS